jgi:phage-related tail fiber protein
VDFAEYTGEVICCVSGHTHMDKIFNLDDGLNIIVTANCSSHVQSIDAPQKTSKTDTEYIMDFVCINKHTRTCHVMRLGAALDQDKTCQIIAVENLADKTSVDYRDGHRINASGDIVENAGYAVTNYIPMALGDIVHVKGFKRISNMFIVVMYNEEKNKIGQSQYTASSASIYAADYDDSVTCFDVSKFSATSSAKYIRISAEIDQTARQIITVNENIEGKTFDGRGFNY